jgi:hypothetical protein
MLYSVDSGSRKGLLSGAQQEMECYRHAAVRGIGVKYNNAVPRYLAWQATSSVKVVTMTAHRVRLVLLSALIVQASPVLGEDAKARRGPDFSRDVFPVLRRACFDCHGKEKHEGDLRLDQRKVALGGGAIVPGKPEESELLRRVSLPRGSDEVMPARGETLSKREIETLREWIRQGAVWPENVDLSKHWSYIAPLRPVRPKLSERSWPKTAIDYFVLERLNQERLKPSPPAAPETLVRRVFLDLIGLPPSPAEIERFLADPSDNAYERLVDDLLSRPQFGERWARPWLDLARYADSHGFQRDDLRDIWAYRDWVVRALNDDMPFDRFTIEQVAGDLLPGATESQRIATGFHRCVPTNVEAGSAPEETRIVQVIDRVNTTGAVWLGTTLECAQCHDHKYDPFTQKDYYRLLAFFNSTEMEADRTNPNVPGSIAFRGPSMPIASPDRDAQRKQLEEELAGLRRDEAQRRKQLASDLEKWAVTQSAELAAGPQTHVLEVVDFESTGSTDSHRILPDGSVLLVGDDPPDRDTYKVRVRTKLTDIRAVRLDALTDESLPGSGPGRGDAKRPNFIVHSFRVSIFGKDAKSTATRVALGAARANYSQPKWDVGGAIDDDPRTGWGIGPRFGEPHWAIFETKEPLDASAGVELLVELDQQFGRALNLGRFRLSAITGKLNGEAAPADVARLLKTAAGQWSAKERQQVLEFRAARDAQLSKVRQEATRLQRAIQSLVPDTTLVMQELAKPRPTALLARGDYRSPGETVLAGTPGVLHSIPTGLANRLTLARWLVDPANPLVARVTVNRWWAEIFGQGIVPTVEDFGIKGEQPSHPELLDWLAVEFAERGWSMKHILRTIVLSATYQQSSRVTPALLAADDRNRWLARGPRFRMEAEMIRDNALAIAGLLSLKQGGPSIRPFQPDGTWTKVGGQAYDYIVSPGEEKYRRGLYVILKRGAPYPSFVNFDASARLACTVKRSRTNTPLQALTLLNDPVYVEAAAALARRIITERPDASSEARLEYAFRLCTARTPDKAELGILQKLFVGQSEASQRNPEAARRLMGDVALPANVSPAEFAAWYSVASTLLNLHETITKG